MDKKATLDKNDVRDLRSVCQSEGCVFSCDVCEVQYMVRLFPSIIKTFRQDFLGISRTERRWMSA